MLPKSEPNQNSIVAEVVPFPQAYHPNQPGIPPSSTPTDTFQSYKEAISFVELYSSHSTMSEVDIVKKDVGCLASLKRKLLPIKGLASTTPVTSVMTGIIPLTQMSLGAGGPVVLVFGFAFASLMAFSIAISLADIASGFPYAKGGLAEYSRRLAPPKLRRFSSWVVGWLHFCALATGTASCAFSFALFGTSAIQISTGTIPSRWVTVLIHIIASLLFGVVNALNLRVDVISLVWNFIGPIIVLLTVIGSVRSPPSTEWVLTHFENQTGWSSSFYVALLGLLQGAFTMTGYDAPIHTMHIVENAALKVPQRILRGFLISFAIGEIIILTLLYGIGDLQEILNPEISGVSVIEIFVHLIGDFGVSCITVIFMGTFFLCGQGILKACSTIGHELAVSGAFPKSQYLSQVGFDGQPARVGWLCAVISCVIGTFYIGNAAILQTLNSAVAMELNLVYCTPVALRLFLPSPTRFQPGPFSLGRNSRPVAAIAVFWSILCVFIFSLPGYNPITTQNMNYASILLVTTLGSIIVYWCFSARYWFDSEQPLISSLKYQTKSEAVDLSLPGTITTQGPIHEKDLDEIENWLDHLERDLRELR